jgi:hypothetical protein
MALTGQRGGLWWLFYQGSQRMFQLSVVGPDDAELAGAGAVFFDSFQLDSPPTP